MSSQCTTSAVLLDRGAGDLLGDLDGLPLSMVYLISFFDEEGSSARWFSTRGFYRDRTRGIRIGEGTSRGELELDGQAEAAVYSGSVEIACEGRQWAVSQGDGLPILEGVGSDFRWTDGTLLRLSGHLAGPAVRITADDPDHPMVYTNIPLRVTGRVSGRPVDGAVLLSTAHMPEGKSYYPSPYVDRRQITWTEFLNENSDGSVENGVLIHGTEGFAVAAIGTSEGAAVATHLETKIRNDGVPAFPSEIQYLLPADSITFSALACGGRFPVRTDMPGEHRLQRGTVRRAGALREPVRSFAFTESYQDRM
jgi:hypothetical protein